MNDFENFFEKERNLEEILRYQIRNKVKRESVAEHLFHVTLYSMIMCDMEKSRGAKIDTERVLKTAIIHDLEESETGDVPFVFKHQSDKFEHLVKDMGKDAIKGIFGKMENSDEYVKLWANQKDMDTIEGKIIFAADRLDVLLFAMREKAVGNNTFDEIMYRVLRGLYDLKLPSLDTILKSLGFEEMYGGG